MTDTIFEKIADGLDACVDGRGWDGEHEKAKNLANAAPKMFETLKGIFPEFESYVMSERDTEIRERGEAWLEQISLVLKAAVTS